MIARPARWREVGEVLVIREEVSLSSESSSDCRRESCVAAKEGMSTAPLGAMVFMSVIRFDERDERRVM